MAEEGKARQFLIAVTTRANTKSQTDSDSKTKGHSIKQVKYIWLQNDNNILLDDNSSKCYAKLQIQRSERCWDRCSDWLKHFTVPLQRSAGPEPMNLM